MNLKTAGKTEALLRSLLHHREQWDDDKFFSVDSGMLLDLIQDLETALEENKKLQNPQKPFSTAPRDGTIFDLWCNIGGFEYGPTGRLPNCYIKGDKLYQINSEDEGRDFHLSPAVVKAIGWASIPEFSVAARTALEQKENG